MIQILTNLCSEFGRRMRVCSIMFGWRQHENVLLLHFLCDSKKIKAFFFFFLVERVKNKNSQTGSWFVKQKMYNYLGIFCKTYQLQM